MSRISRSRISRSNICHYLYQHQEQARSKSRSKRIRRSVVWEEIALAAAAVEDFVAKDG